MSRLTETIRDAYQVFAEDPEAIWDHLEDVAVFHVSGAHPLSGAYVGAPEVRRYLAAVRAATGGRGGFSVTSAFADDSGEVVMVEGTAFHGDEPFVRTIVHRLRLRNGRLVEFRDHPFDQQAEDRFWSARVPAQRDGNHGPDATAGPPGGGTESADAAVIPAQPTSTHITRG